MVVLSGRKRYCGNDGAEFRVENPGGTSVSASYIANACPRCDVRAPGNALDQIENGLIRRLITTLPKAMVHVLAPNLAIIAVQFVVMLGDFMDRRGARRADHRANLPSLEQICAASRAWSLLAFVRTNIDQNG